MAYLDGEAAYPIYQNQADFIKSKNLSGIVDIGCRTGTVNRWLSEHEYDYFGFDTSPEPIHKAKSLYPGCNFQVADWNDPPQAVFDVDVVLFSSVLIYAGNPYEMFEKLCNFYQPTWAIVHEINTRNTEDFNYTDLEYWSNKYPCMTQELSLDIPCGERTIIYAQYKKFPY